MSEETGDETKKIGVIPSLVVNCIEVAGLGVAAWITGSTALRAQTAVNVAEVAVVVFLLLGVLKSVREPDERHPLGHGRERFFWSLFAARSTRPFNRRFIRLMSIRTHWRTSCWLLLRCLMPTRL